MQPTVFYSCCRLVMNIKHGLLVVAVAWVYCCAIAGETPPYGAADFVPSDTQPIGWRADGNGYYPGANPPMEWWDGTPEERDVRTRTGARMKAVDLKDAVPKNILWKSEVPGWSLAHPIVVGKRAFVVGEPDFVACYDLDTGKQLWQRRMMPLLCAGQSEEKAVAAQKVLDLARALWLVSMGWSWSGLQVGNCFYQGSRHLSTNEEPDVIYRKRREFAEKLVRMVERHLPEIKAFGDADLTTAAEADLEILKRLALANNLDEMNEFAKQKSMNLREAVWKKLKVPIGGIWYGYVGSADSTLASDGQHIYGCFTQGQVFCLDLEGRLVWARHVENDQPSANFHRSPHLVGDVLITRVGLGVVSPKSSGGLQALDKKTGRLLWQDAAAITHQMEAYMRLKNPKGAMVDVICCMYNVPKKGIPLLRVSDGVVLGYLPEPPSRTSNPVQYVVVRTLAHDRLVINGYDSFGSGSPSLAYQVRLIGDDHVDAVELWRQSRSDTDIRGLVGTDQMVSVADGRIIVNTHIMDGTTGAVVGIVPATREFSRGGAPIIGGRRLITFIGTDGNGEGGRERADRMAIGRYGVYDIEDPVRPRRLSENSVLGYAGPPSDYIVSTYFKEFDPYIFAKCYGGSMPHFCAEMGGVIPAGGERLLIQSTRYLYCIGPAVKGTPKDDPKVVAGIRTAPSGQALTDHLASPSAQYRYEALLRLAALKVIPADGRSAVEKLCDSDIYEEIRAAAVMVLEAVYPGEGLQRVRTNLIKEAALKEPALTAMRAGPTLRCLAPEMQGRVLVPMLEDATQRQIATDAIRSFSLASSSEVRDALLRVQATLSAPGEQRLRGEMAIALGDLFGREAAVRELLIALALDPKSDARLFVPYVFGAVVDRLNGEEQVAFMAKLLARPKVDEGFTRPIAERIARMRPVRIDAVKALLACSTPLNLGAMTGIASPSEELIALMKSGLNNDEWSLTCALVLLSWRKGGEAQAVAALERLYKRDPLPFRPDAVSWLGHAAKPLKAKETRVKAAAVLAVAIGKTPTKETRMTRSLVESLAVLGADSAAHLALIETLGTAEDKDVAEAARKAVDAIIKNGEK